MTKDNQEVFYEKVPEDLPADALPNAKRVVEEELLQLPSPAAEATPTALSCIAQHVAKGQAAGGVQVAAAAEGAGAVGTADVGDVKVGVVDGAGGEGAAAREGKAGAAAGATHPEVTPAAGPAGAPGGGPPATGTEAAPPGQGKDEKQHKKQSGCCVIS